MRTPQAGSRLPSPPRASLRTDLRDALFFDPLTINDSSAATQQRDPSALFSVVTDVDEASGVESSQRAAEAASSSDCVYRRGQAYRRVNASGRVGSRSHACNLGNIATNMKSDMGLSGPATSSATSAPVVQASSFTRAMLAERVGKPDSAYLSTPLELHEGQPLLPMSDFATAATTVSVAAQASTTVALSALHSSEVADGSVHVARRPPRVCEQPGLSPLREGALSSEFDSGVELTMESVTLQLSERCYFRMHPVTYLDDCSLHIAPGSMHCIASLNPVYARAALAVLAGVDVVASTKGAALANALPTSSLRYRRQVAYVASLDGCTGEATVYENLLFATRIRYLVDAQTLREVVEQAASDTFLIDHLQTRVLDLSSAQRYLLATAMELVTNPTVLLLQDPLSFFSLADLQLFTQLLQCMRRRNPARTVVWSGSTIPWTLFDSIDNLTLLTTGGKTFFTGRKENVETFLQENLGILRVPGEGVMDIIAQTEVDDVAVTYSTTAFRSSNRYRELQYEIEAHRNRISANAFPTPPERTRPSPSYGSVQSSLLYYTFRRNVLCTAALVPWAGFFVVMMLVCILVAAANEQQRGQVLQNTCGTVFLLLSCSVQINAIFFNSELRDWRTFLSFRENLYFPVAPYYVATLVRLLAPRLCFAVAGSVCGAAILAPATAVSLSAIMSLLSFTHACLGLIVVYWFPMLEMLQVANHLYYAYCVICCGFLMSVSQIPVFFQVLSLLRVAYGGLLAKEIAGLTCRSSMTSGTPFGADVSESSTDCITGENYLALMGLQNDSLWKSILGLSLLSFVMMAALAMSMHLSPSARLFSHSSKR
ncbi:hypothetical protein ABL78_1034 [Leptomonas seymouri]|uniref:ABC transporter domain-containing protein n=1 Tax=Leptomonas seymouri TaxID=5684 RepID=A0A0N1I194_LEPSE|nr:hypothetical protein ABL78_1034 [Leptomonas seymouri]|eukprot:KPI89865.1 hypothetical protein ABL78_1034 [Leptomonas seymouri]